MEKIDIMTSAKAFTNDREQNHWTNKLAFPSMPTSLVTSEKKATILNKWWAEKIFYIVRHR